MYFFSLLSTKLSGKTYLQVTRQQFYRKALSYVGRECCQYRIISFGWPHHFISIGLLRIMFVIACGFIVSTVWLCRRPAKASSNRDPTFFPVLNVNHRGFFLVCVATGLDEDTLTGYFFIRYRPRVCSLSVLV